MLLRWLLFETRVGEMILALIERKVGLAVVQAEGLAEERSGDLTAVGQAQ